MNQCTQIQDLLPLYIDGVVSEESRQAIAHLAQCPDCRRRLAALEAPLPAELSGTLETNHPDAPATAGFLKRLQRQIGTTLGLVLVLLVLTAWLAVHYVQQTKSRAFLAQITQEQQKQIDAFTALSEYSPDPLQLLKKRNIFINAESVRLNDQLVVYFQVDWRRAPNVDFVVSALHPLADTFQLLDPRTGTPIPAPGSEQSKWGEGDLAFGQHDFKGISSDLKQVLVEFPVLLAHTKVEEPAHWEFRRPGPNGEVTISEQVSVAGVSFEVEKVVFDGERVRIHYRQLTDTTVAGVHYLSFG